MAGRKEKLQPPAEKPVRRRLSQKAIRDALLATYGNIPMTAKTLGCGRSTVYRWIDRYPKLQEAAHDAKGQLGDLCLAKLVKAIHNDTPSLIKDGCEKFYFGSGGSEGGEVNPPRVIYAIPAKMEDEEEWLRLARAQIPVQPSSDLSQI